MSDCCSMIPCWKMIVIELAHLQVLSVNVAQTEKLQNIFCFIVHNISTSERTLLNLPWIYWNALKSGVCQTMLNFYYSLHPSTVSPSLRIELLKIYCLSFCPALNARYNLPSLTFLHWCYYTWWFMHWIYQVFIHTAVSSLVCLHREVICWDVFYLWCPPWCYRARYRPSSRYTTTTSIYIVWEL